jgi:gluconate 2-dehydrogenase gamma chain
VTTWATACTAQDEGGSFSVLSASEAADLEAIASCIFPSGDTPGAVEAGVIHFIDAALGGLQAESLEAVRRGLEELQANVRSEQGESSFASLDPERQIAMLQGIEDTDFFGTMRLLTLAGMFSHPSYGGNRDEIGWTLIGFDAQGPTPPPFGYYDADYAEKGA